MKFCGKAAKHRCLNRDVVYVHKQYFATGRGKEKNEWVGNSHKTIVLTAGKDIDSFHCSQCCHTAECLCLSQECKILLFVTKQNHHH